MSYCTLVVGIYQLVYDNTALVFKTIIVTMNLITIATYFNKTCKAIFDHFWMVEFIKSRFFDLVSTHFEIVETNRKGISHLYCLDWLTKITNLSYFQQKTRDNFSYFGQVFYFLNYIIITSLSVYFSNLFSIRSRSRQIYFLTYYQKYRRFLYNINCRFE